MGVASLRKTVHGKFKQPFLNVFDEVKFKLNHDREASLMKFIFHIQSVTSQKFSKAEYLADI